MSLALEMLNSSSPIVCMVVGLTLLGISTFARRLNSRKVTVPDAPAEEGVRVRLQDRKLVSIERRSTARQAAAQPLQRVSNG